MSNLTESIKSLFSRGDMSPDEQMEEEYNSFVMEEVLSPEELKVIGTAVEAVPDLQPVLDNLVLKASEFRGEGEVDGPGHGTSDSIPARLSDGEFVFTKKAVDQIGVENLEQLMAEAEEAASRTQMNMGGLVTNKASDKPEDNEVEKMMLKANRSPSLLNR